MDDLLEEKFVSCDMKQMNKWLKSRGYQITRKMDVNNCRCEFPDLGIIPGYRGRKELGCYNCTNRCPSCHEPSLDNGYNEGICYNCAIRNNEECDGCDWEECDRWDEIDSESDD